MIRHILAVALLPVLVACASTPKIVVPDEPVIAPKTTVIIPTGLIAPCPPLPALDESRPYTQGDTLDVLASWINLYGVCAARFEKYVSLTSNALNINQNSTPDKTDSSK